MLTRVTIHNLNSLLSINLIKTKNYEDTKNVFASRSLYV
jgi:hypothetical protein